MGQALAKETIKTGLTPNYISHWGLWEAMREVAQNMAWASVAQGLEKNLRVEYHKDEGVGIIGDEYQGLRKSHLYIGEGEQRNHERGMGYFGEGLKMAMLVFAREGVKHVFNTVGFSFFGELQETDHGTEILVIRIQDNLQEIGTTAMIEIDERTFMECKEGFAPLMGIDVPDHGIIPGRKEEIWVRGVKIATKENPNPVNVFYSYNLQHKELTNRDRTIIDHYRVYSVLKEFWAKYATEKEIVEFIQQARNPDNYEYEDLKKGPSLIRYDDVTIKKWKKCLEKAYGCPITKLLWKSKYDTRNYRAKQMGYVIISDLPDAWEAEFVGYLKMIKTVDFVSLTTPKENQLEEPLSQEESDILFHAITLCKGVLRASDLLEEDDIPKIKVIEQFEEASEVENGILATLNRKDKEITLSRECLVSDEMAFHALFHEIVHWVSDATDFSAHFNHMLQKLLSKYIVIHSNYR